MSNDERSRATEALIRTCSTNTLHLNHIKNQIKSMWNEFELEDYLEEKKSVRTKSLS